MKRFAIASSACFAFMAGLAGTFAIAGGGPIGTVFTYQCKVMDSGAPADGTYDFVFRLHDDAVAISQVGSDLILDDIVVTEGLVTIDLDFGSVFDGTALWLEIDLKADADVTYDTLAPRQPLNATPYALHATSAASATTAADATNLNGQAASFYTNAANLGSGTLPDGRLSGTYGSALTLSNAGNSFTGDGTGLTNLAWGNLTGVPAGFADGVDNDTNTTYSAGAGLVLIGTTFSLGAHSHNAADITSGTLNDSRLSNNVPLLNADNAFTGVENSFNVVTATEFRTPQAANLNKFNLWGSSDQYSIGMSGGHPYGFVSTWATTFTNANVANYGWVWRDVADASGDGAMSLTTDGRLTLKSTAALMGNVGVGTSTPASKLDVVGDVRANRLVDRNDTSYYVDPSGSTSMNAAGDVYANRFIPPGTSDYDKLRVYNSSNYTIGMVSGNTFGFLNDWATTFTMNSDTDRGWLWRDVNDTAADGAMSLTTAGQLYIKNTFQIGSGSSVGSSSGGYQIIGTDTGSSLRFDTNEVQSFTSGAAGGTLYLNFWGGDVRLADAGGNVLLPDPASRVGIGTSNPDDARLEINAGPTRAIWATSSADASAPTIYADHPATTEQGAAIEGRNDDTAYYGYGVRGYGGYRGVNGDATVAGTGFRYGVYGVGGNATTANYGVFGTTTGSSGTEYGVYSSGNAHVSGTLSKTGGAFRIDHPLDPENKELWHSFVESPDMMNIYNGIAVLDSYGRAVVELPDYFETLNRDFRYQLTPIGAPMRDLYIASKVTGNRFEIAGGKPGMEVSWEVTGIRQDPWAEANRIPNEVEKREEDKGLYLHPEAYGQSQQKGVDWKHSAEGSEEYRRQFLEAMGES